VSGSRHGGAAHLDRPLLSTSDLHKAYAAPVLSGVSLDVRAGEVHALVGENGAGKSTLVKIVAGIVRAEAGAMTFKGEPFTPSSKVAAEAAGVRLVMQELNLVNTLSVAENLFLDRLPRRFGVVNRRRLAEEARQALALVGLDGLDPATPVGALGVGRRQLVEIAASLARRCDLLILDEPTAALTARETDLLFAQVARLKAEGVGVIYISHRLDELRRVADRVSVLRDGRLVATHRAAEVTADQLVREMVGREVGSVFERGGRSPETPGAVALRVEGLTAGAAVRGVSFEVRRGEVLGFAGLMGSGRTETMRAVFGADRRDAGDIYVGGSARPARIRSPRDAVRLGLAFVTEDRREQGLLLPHSIRANVTLTRLRPLARFGVVNRGRELHTAEEFVRALGVRCRSSEQPVAHLSGGNQQKVVIAKWLWREPDVLIFDEPTRGIDVGAKFELYRLIADFAARGKAVVVVSSELEELTALCDRIAVMSAGKLVATFARGEWDQDKIMSAAFSGYAAVQSREHL
jgi:ribose transport system ATP-binding protein